MTLLEPQPNQVALGLPDHGPPALSQIRDEIRAMLAGHVPARVEDVLLVCTELIANAYAHGAPPVSFRLSQPTPDLVRIEVGDGSPEMPVERHPVVDETHGRGVLLVARLSLRWGVSPDDRGKTVWAELAVPELDAGPGHQGD
jgi:hypothetical protein